MSEHEREKSTMSAVLRTIAAIGVVLAFALGVYLLLDATQPVAGLVSFTFLLILPAAICAFIAYVADPWGTRSRRSYIMIPLWLLLAVIVAAAFVLREGIICIAILSPLWLGSGMAGAALTYSLRHRNRDGRTYCVALLALPLIAMQVEPMIPLPVAMATVSRTIDIDTTPARIWPLLRGIPDVKPGEGRWNLSQNVIGIPRPIGAHMVGEGVGADRYANWGAQIRFRERITQWQPGRALSWRFIFDDVRGWAMTDRHLMPNSPYFQVTTGGYRMEPLGPARTRVTLDTRYRITTPVNAYSELWGQLLLGDLENNLLALVKQRAERGQSGRAALSARP